MAAQVAVAAAAVVVAAGAAETSERFAPVLTNLPIDELTD